MIRQLSAMGFQFELVLANSLYGENECNFISTLVSLKLPYIVAIWSNHDGWFLLGQMFRLLIPDPEKEIARLRFEHHFGALNLEQATDIDNESIDADLAREYTSPHQKPSEKPPHSCAGRMSKGQHIKST